MRYVFDTTAAPKGKPEKPWYVIRQVVSLQGKNFVSNYAVHGAELSSYTIVGFYHPDGAKAIKEWLADYPHPRNSKVNLIINNTAETFIVVTKVVTSEVANPAKCEYLMTGDKRCELPYGHKGNHMYNSTFDAIITVPPPIPSKKITPKYSLLILTAAEKQELVPFVNSSKFYDRSAWKAQASLWGMNPDSYD